MNAFKLESKVMLRIGTVLLLFFLTGSCRKDKEYVSDSMVTEQKGYALKGQSEQDIQNMMNERLADLKKRYAGTISAHTDVLEAAEHFKRVSQLMIEWNPIGYSTDDVKELLGKPTVETSDSLEYHFVIGTSVVMWRFSITDNKVTGVGRVIGI